MITTRTLIVCVRLNLVPVNFDNRIGACGFVPILLKKLFPYIIIKLDKDGEPVRDPQTGLCVKCAFGEPGELVGKIDKGTRTTESSIITNYSTFMIENNGVQ